MDAIAVEMGPSSHGSDPVPPLCLHIGGVEPQPGWTVVNIQAGPAVDVVGSASDLSAFADETVSEIYASHVYEHLGYQHELPAALREAHRVLRPGGAFRISVPDLECLCRLFLAPSLKPEHRFHLMRILYGGQIDPFDFHKVGYTFEILCGFLRRAGFSSATRVAEHGLFRDTSSLRLFGIPISLNVVATR